MADGKAHMNPTLLYGLNEGYKEDDGIIRWTGWEGLADIEECPSDGGT
jgi:hypothetical protein